MNNINETTTTSAAAASASSVTTDYYASFRQSSSSSPSSPLIKRKDSEQHHHPRMVYHDLDEELRYELDDILNKKPEDGDDNDAQQQQDSNKKNSKENQHQHQEDHHQQFLHLEEEEDEDNLDNDDIENKRKQRSRRSSSVYLQGKSMLHFDELRQEDNNTITTQNNNKNNNEKSKRGNSPVIAKSTRSQSLRQSRHQHHHHHRSGRGVNFSIMNHQTNTSNNNNNDFLATSQAHSKAVEEHKEQLRLQSQSYREALAKSINERMEHAESTREHQHQRWAELRQGFGGRTESWLTKIILVNHLINSNWERTLNEMKARERLRRLLLPMLKLKMHIMRKRRFFAQQVLKPQEEAEEVKQAKLSKMRRMTRVDDDEADLDDVDALNKTLMMTMNRGSSSTTSSGEVNTQQHVDENNNNNNENDQNPKPSVDVLIRKNPILHRWPRPLVERLVSEMQPRAFLNGSQPLVRGQDPRSAGGLFFFVSVGRLMVGEDMAMRASLVHREKILATTTTAAVSPTISSVTGTGKPSFNNNTESSTSQQSLDNTLSGTLSTTSQQQLTYSPSRGSYVPSINDQTFKNENNQHNNSLLAQQYSASFRASPTNLELQTTLLAAHQTTQIEQKKTARRLSLSAVQRVTENFVMATYRLKAGEYYGEIPIFCGDRFNASVRCVTDCILYCISGKRFWELVSDQQMMARRTYNLCLHAAKLILKLQVDRKPTNEDLKSSHSMFACWPNAALNELLSRHAYPLILMKGEILTRDIYDAPCTYFVDSGELRYVVGNNNHNNNNNVASTSTLPPFKPRSVIAIQSFSRYEMSQYFENEDEVKRRKQQEKMRQKREHIQSMRRSTTNSMGSQQNIFTNNNDQDEIFTTGKKKSTTSNTTINNKNITNPPGVPIQATELSVVWAFPIEDMIRLVKKFPTLEPRVVEAAGEMVFDETMKRATTLIRQLKPFQNNLRPRNLFYLQELFHPLVAVAGSVLCRAGGEVAEVFIVVEGTVKWQKRQYHETLDDLTMERKNVFETTDIKVSGPGETVGLAECLIGKQFVNWCVAEKSVILLRAKASHIQKVLESRFSEENAWSIVFSVMNDREKMEARVRQREAEAKRLVTMSVLPSDDGNTGSQQLEQQQQQQQMKRSTKHVKTRQELELEAQQQKELLKQKRFAEKHPSLAKLQNINNSRNGGDGSGGGGGNGKDFFAPPGTGVDLNAARKLCQQRVTKEMNDAEKEHDRREYQRTHRPPSPRSEWLAATLEARRVDLRRLGIEQRVMTSISSLVFGDRVSSQDKFVAQYFGESIVPPGSTSNKKEQQEREVSKPHQYGDGDEHDFGGEDQDENDDDDTYSRGDEDDDDDDDDDDLGKKSSRSIRNRSQRQRRGGSSSRRFRKSGKPASLGDFYKSNRQGNSRNNANEIDDDDESQIPPVKIKRMYPDFIHNDSNNNQIDNQVREEQQQSQSKRTTKSPSHTKQNLIVAPLLVSKEETYTNNNNNNNDSSNKQNDDDEASASMKKTMESTTKYVAPSVVDGGGGGGGSGDEQRVPKQQRQQQQQQQQQQRIKFAQPPVSDLELHDPSQQKHRDNSSQKQQLIKNRTSSPIASSAKSTMVKQHEEEEQNQNKEIEENNNKKQQNQNLPTLEQVIIESKTKKQFKESEAFSRHRREADVSDEVERFTSSQLNTMAMDFLVSNCSALTRKRFIPSTDGNKNQNNNNQNLSVVAPNNSNNNINNNLFKTPRLPPLPESARNLPSTTTNIKNNDQVNSTQTTKTARPHPPHSTSSSHHRGLVSKSSVTSFQNYRNQEKMKTDELLIALMKPPTK